MSINVSTIAFSDARSHAPTLQAGRPSLLIIIAEAALAVSVPVLFSCDLQITAAMVDIVMVTLVSVVRVRMYRSCGTVWMCGSVFVSVAKSVKSDRL